MRKKIVITGIGLISSLGSNKEIYWRNLWDGKSGIKTTNLYTSRGKNRLAGEIVDFDFATLVDKKRLHNLDRITKFAIFSSKMALKDAEIIQREDVTNEMGIVVGTMLGGIESISNFDKESVVEGPRYVNPARFPNTLLNSPASQVSIWSGIKGFSVTIATGFSAGLDAMGYAIDCINLNRAKVILVGGVEALCTQMFLGFDKLDFLAGSRDDKEEICTPFDKRRNGIVLGEGSCTLVLEEFQFAKDRGAKIYAEMSGYGTVFSSPELDKYSPNYEGAQRSMCATLDSANLKPDDIDYICASANSTIKYDLMETNAIKDVFGPKAKEIPISSIKSMIGECLGASGTFQIAAAIGTLLNNRISPTINYKEPDPKCNLDYVPNKVRRANINRVMINSFGPNGKNSSLIISRYEK